MIFFLAWHDFLLLVKDRKTMLILVLMPILLMTILGFSLASSFETEALKEPATLGIVKLYSLDDADESWLGPLTQNLGEETAKELTQIAKKMDLESLFFDDFLGNEKVKAFVTYDIMDAKTAEAALLEGRVTGILYLPKDFIKDLSMSMMLPLRNQTEPILKLKRAEGLKGSVLRGVIGGFLDDFNRRIAAKQTFSEALALNSNVAPDYQAIGEEMKNLLSADFEKSVEVTVKGIPQVKSIGSIAYYAAGMMCMFLLFSAGQGGRMFLEEKEQNTLQRQLVSGLQLWDIILSKWLTLILISMTQTTIMVIYSALVLGVEWVNIGQVVVITLFSSLAVAGMGVFVGVVTYKIGDYKLANMMESLIIQVMAFLGGSFIPLAVLPNFVEKLSFLTINGLTLKALQRTMQGFGYEAFNINLVILLMIAGTFMGGAALVLGKAKVIST